MKPEEATRIAEEAYIFAYPILENYRTMDRVTGINTAKEKRRYFNTLHHTSKLLGPEFKNIVAPNNDTLYSSSWLDLADGPLVLTVPDIPDRRYYVFQMVNMYNHNFGYIGARTTGYSAADFLISGPEWDGDIPATISQDFRSESRFAFLIGRTLIDGQEDLPAVKKIQAGYKLQPLDAYLGNPVCSAPRDPEIPPYDKEAALGTGFIRFLNYILGHALIHPDEADMISQFSVIGIDPGSQPDLESIPDEITESIKLGIHRAREKIRQKTREIGHRVKGWRSLAGAHGPRETMQGRYLVNAAGAMLGLYGNDEAEASNFAAFSDESGGELDASRHNYILRFEENQLPPVNAFWSITMYRHPEILLVDNPINRYSIGDRTRGLTYSEDGSLEIYLQFESPGKNRESNWLPAPPGVFLVALRCYLPDMECFPDYQPPGIRIVPGANVVRREPPASS